MNKKYTRWQLNRIKEALLTRRVVLLSGSRQCGKTTLVKQLIKADTRYLTLDDLALREIAINDPHGFAQNNGTLVIIDEIQRAPNLLSAIKMVVDENTQPGQYLLTGSANLHAIPNALESLAGRIRKIRLRPLSQGEVLACQPNFLTQAFNNQFSKSEKNLYDRNAILKIAFRGGFPEAIELEPKDRAIWHRDYVTALLERDLRDIARITRHSAMQELVAILAAWSGKFMDFAALGSGLAVRRPTLETYVNALEALYLVERVLPWTRTDYERVGKHAKIYMTDSGLMTSILRWHFPQVMLDPDRSGKLIETFVFNELAAQVDAANGEYRLYQYRDREKREIDFLIEREDHALVGIEVKAGSQISMEDFKHLKWFKENISKNRPFIGIVLYTGLYAGTMGDNLWALPFNALWE